MPTKKGYGKEIIAKNIKTEMKSGKSQKQSISTALSIAEKAQSKNKK